MFFWPTMPKWRCYAIMYSTTFVNNPDTKAWWLGVKIWVCFATKELVHLDHELFCVARVKNARVKCEINFDSSNLAKTGSCTYRFCILPYFLFHIVVVHLRLCLPGIKTWEEDFHYDLMLKRIRAMHFVKQWGSTSNESLRKNKLQ